MNAAENLPKRRISYSIQEKLRYLEDFEAALLNRTVRTLADFAANYNIPYATIRYWNRAELEQEAHDKHGKSKKVRTKQIGLWTDMENELYEWYQGVSGRRIPVAVQDLQKKGLELFQQWWNQLEDADREEIAASKPVLHNFRASCRWAAEFKNRKNISLRKVNKNSSELPADAAARCEVFRNNVNGTIDRFGIQMRFVFNFDQTFVLFDIRPMYTCEEKGAKVVDVRTSRSNPKLGCTVTLCITAAGGKDIAHITFPRQGFVGRLNDLQDEDLPANVCFSSSATGWMKEETIHQWTDHVLEPLIEREGCEQFLLIMDRFRVHRTETFCNRVIELGAILEYVPAGCTSLVQPLDVAVMKSFKSHARGQWKTWKQFNTNEDGKCRQIDLRDVVQIVSEAWDAVDERVIHNGFESAFRPQNIDGGPQPVPEEDGNEGLEFFDVHDEDVDDEH